MQLDKGFSILEITGKVVPQGSLVRVVKGVWRFAWGRLMAELAPQDKAGGYARPSYDFEGYIGEGPMVLESGADGVAAAAADFFPAESGRYHVYLGNPCPWCHRVALTIALCGLSEHVGCTRLIDDPTRARRGGWCFAEPGEAPSLGGSGSGDSGGGAYGPDPVFSPGLDLPDLYGVYDAASPGFKGRCTAPLLVDAVTRRVVSNDSRRIVSMLNRLAAVLHPEPTPAARRGEDDQGGFGGEEGGGFGFGGGGGGGEAGVRLRPAEEGGATAAAVEEAVGWVTTLVNNGVYRCGFATRQAAYDAATRDVLEGLQRADRMLEASGGPFLFGDTITEADVCLFPTCVRFDAVYAPLFRAGPHRIRDFKHLDQWMRAVWRVEGVAGTVDLRDAWGSYYKQLFPLNPSGLVPALPDPKDLGLPPSPLPLPL